jgi:hypothetical protein
MDVVRLDQYDEKYVVDGTIYSGGLGPCIAIAVYNRRQKKAWMIHHPNMDSNQPLDTFFKKATQGTKIKNLTIFVTGCSIDGIESESDRHCRLARQYTEEILAKWFTEEQVVISWSEPGALTEMIIDTHDDIVEKVVNGESIRLDNSDPKTDILYYDSNGNPVY